MINTNSTQLVFSNQTNFILVKLTLLFLSYVQQLLNLFCYSHIISFIKSFQIIFVQIKLIFRFTRVLITIQNNY